MIHDFAVEPEALNNWDDFRYVMEKFGFHQGRIVSRFPGKWERRVIKAINPEAHGTVKAAKLIELLRMYSRDRIVDTGHVWDSAKGWLENAIAQHDSSNPFHAILAAESNQEFGVMAVGDADEAVFEVDREIPCQRTATALVATVLPLARHASIVRLVDRVILAKPGWDQARWLEFVTALDDAMQGGRLQPTIEFHCVTRDANPEHETENLRHAARVLAGRNIEFLVWVAEAKDASHRRYVLTDRGGIGIDAGLDVASESLETDVSILDHNLWARRMADFDRATSPYQLFRSFIV